MKTIEKTLVKPIVFPKALKFSLEISLFVLLTALGAYIYLPLPFTPVPITLQTLFVLLSGVILGPFRGMLSQLFYVSFGLAGVPVFAGASSGLAVLFGPTGGYLIGFIFAPLFAGLLAKKNNSPIITILSFVAGEIPIFLFGLTFLCWYVRVPMRNALILGLTPFIPGEIVKICFGYWVVRARRRILR